MALRGAPHSGVGRFQIREAVNGRLSMEATVTSGLLRRSADQGPDTEAVGWGKTQTGCMKGAADLLLSVSSFFFFTFSGEGRVVHS